MGGVNDLTERRCARKSVRHAKIRVVENIEELKADAELSVFPTRQSGIFHDRHVGAEVARAMEAIAALGKVHGGASTRI